MNNPWDDIPSIWDGWTAQCFGQHADHGRYCADGWLMERHKKVWWSVDVHHRWLRVRQWIESSEGYDGHLAPIPYANDLLRWTPDQFRDLDRRLEWEHQQAQIGRQIDAIPVEVSV